jgi:hypothetical protein
MTRTVSALLSLDYENIFDAGAADDHGPELISTLAAEDDDRLDLPNTPEELNDVLGNQSPPSVIGREEREGPGDDPVELDGPGDDPEELEGADTSSHRQQRPGIPRKTFHPYLDGRRFLPARVLLAHDLTATARPCNADGDFLPEGAPPIPVSKPSWSKFHDKNGFLLAEHLYAKYRSSGRLTDELLSIMLAKHEDAAPFKDHKELYEAIDAIAVGEAPWIDWEYDDAAGEEISADSPSWKRKKHLVRYRDPLKVVKNMLQNESFDGEFDYVPFSEINKKGNRNYHDLMSAQWAWEEAVRLEPCFRRIGVSDVWCKE